MTNSAKTAKPDHPVESVIAERFSPYAYDPRPVEREKLLSCLEAARWAASSFNEQPWSFIVAERNDAGAFNTMLECLMEANQTWAKDAGVLIVTVACKTFTRNGKPNRVAEHDLGLAVGNLSVQATALGLCIHQMAGINLPKTRQTYNIPDGHDPLTAFTIGYAADPDTLDNADLAARDRAPRSRKPLADFIFENTWSNPASLVRP